MVVAIAVSVLGSGCFNDWSLRTEPSWRISVMIERSASTLELNRSRIAMLVPEDVLIAAGVDSIRTACAAMGREGKPKVNIAKKRAASRGANRLVGLIDLKFRCRAFRNELASWIT